MAKTLAKFQANLCRRAVNLVDDYQKDRRNRTWNNKIISDLKETAP